MDYKTGNPKTKLIKGDKYQLFIYQMAAEEVLGWEVEKLTFHYLNDNTRVSFLGKSDDLIDYKEKILETILEIIKLHFIPKPSEINCKYCDFNNICSYRQK